MCITLAPVTAFAAANETAGNATELAAALTAVTDGGTITLTADIPDYASAILINSNNIIKSFSLDLSGHTLTSARGIEMVGNYTLTVQGPGTFNMTSSSYGIYASAGGKFVVTGGAMVNAAATGRNVRGAYATGSGSTVTVTGDATATGEGGIGAYAVNGGSVTVGGSATGGSTGAYASGNGGSTVTVSGDVTGGSYGARADNVGSVVTVGGNATGGSYGASTDVGGQITIDGTATAPIRLGSIDKFKDDYEAETTKPGYRTYANGANIVWVKGALLSDVIAPTVSSGSVIRVSETEAIIGFTTNEAGTAYYLVVASGATAPAKAAVKAGASLGAVAAGTVSGKDVTLTAGAKDIYVVVEDAEGNISEPLKIAVEEGITPALRVNGGAPLTAVAAIKSAIETALGSGSTATVTGTFVGATTTLNLTIPTGRTVTWDASLEGSAATLVSISGGGTLDVAAGLLKTSGEAATISVAANTAVKVSGGTVEATGSTADAIYFNGVGAKVEVTGGEVKAVYIGIECGNNSIVSVSGGTGRLLRFYPPVVSICFPKKLRDRCVEYRNPALLQWCSSRLLGSFALLKQQFL
ncbi:hypothetical protein FACS1894182_00210 [Bacteroidia bacterium]|nr:hypothetical protein FACS1894182_00210 [Bacteroidia bacterium]